MAPSSAMEIDDSTSNERQEPSAVSSTATDNVALKVDEDVLKTVPVKRDNDAPKTTIGLSASPNKKLRRGTKIPVWNDDDTDTNASKVETKPRKKKKSNDSNDIDDMAWICGECKEAECMMQPDADEFLLCDGQCHRVFHFPCAGLPELPKSEEDWLCKDCAKGQHQCSFCHGYGKDNEDVFSCRRANCGLFFHESCLAMHNVEVVNTVVKSTSATVPTTAESNKEETTSRDNGMDGMEGMSEHEKTNISTAEATTVPIFTCPAHACWTCTQKDAKEKEEQEEKANTTPKGGKKRKSKKKKQSIFQCKTETRLFRCLFCPWAYHASCIPPPSRFHELAVLCPEHSSTHKLPDLDLSTSLQGTVEDKIDRKMLKLNGVKKPSRRKTGGASSNPFFPGMRGDRLASPEKYFLEYCLTQNGGEGNDDMMGGDDLGFCLPCDVKVEVHSKPPSYTHVHGPRYDPNNRPKKIASSRERCQCEGKCGEDCFNKMLMIECYGDGGQSSNCQVGGDDCGNRPLGKRQFVKCKPKREGGKGWGLAALQDIPKGGLVLEYAGEIIDEAAKETRLVEWNREHPNDPNFYVMALSGGWYIDAREYANMSRFINHSCDPSCKVVTINVKGYKRCGIFSQREIAAGEFLSYDYHFDTNQADRFSCRCGAKNCRGTMQGRNGTTGEPKKPLNWKEAKARYDLDKKFLDDMKGKEVISQVDAFIPAAEQPTEFVCAGPPDKHRDSAIRNRIFLWRNASRGADFGARNSRLETPPKARTACIETATKTPAEEKDILSIIRKHNSGDLKGK